MEHLNLSLETLARHPCTFCKRIQPTGFVRRALAFYNKTHDTDSVEDRSDFQSGSVAIARGLWTLANILGRPPLPSEGTGRNSEQLAWLCSSLFILKTYNTRLMTTRAERVTQTRETPHHTRERDGNEFNSNWC